MIAQILARLAKATPGEWIANGNAIYDATSRLIAGTYGMRDKVDADFIARAPSDIAFLLAENDRLKDDLAIAKADAELIDWIERNWERCGFIPEGEFHANQLRSTIREEMLRP